MPRLKWIPDIPQTIFYSVVSLLCIVSTVFIIIEEYALSVTSVLVLVGLYAISDLKKNVIFLLIGSFFIGGYLVWPLRLQVVNIVGYILFLYFITNFYSNTFNNLTIPKILKISIFLLLTSFSISLIRTPHFIPTAVYLTYLFFTFILIFYIVFRSVFTVKQIENYLLFFIYCTAIAGIVIILQIGLTGNIRSLGIAGFAIMDIAAMSLVIVILMYFMLGHSNITIKISSVIIFIILITTLSRFAWLGFTLSLVYGVLISVRFASKTSGFLKNRVLLLILGGLVFVGIFFSLGLHTLVIVRFTDLNFDELFKPTSSGDVLIENSLETRLLIWVVALNTFTQNMWTGVGYQMFSVVSENYNMLPQRLYEDFVMHLDVHTTYFNILVDTGIIGLSCFLFFILLLFRISYKAIKYSTSLDELRVSIALHVLIFFVAVHSIYSGAFTFGQNAFSFYLIAGLTVANYVILKNQTLTKR